MPGRISTNQGQDERHKSRIIIQFCGPPGWQNVRAPVGSMVCRTERGKNLEEGNMAVPPAQDKISVSLSNLKLEGALSRLNTLVHVLGLHAVLSISRVLWLGWGLPCYSSSNTWASQCLRAPGGYTGKGRCQCPRSRAVVRIKGEDVNHRLCACCRVSTQGTAVTVTSS